MNRARAQFSTTAESFAVPGVAGHRCDAATADAINKGLVALARVAYAAQGMAAFDQTRKAAAIHEAGHVVVAIALGQTVERVKVWRSFALGAWRWEGHTLYRNEEWRVDETTSALDDAHFAMNTFAGVASEMLFAGDDYKLGSSLDEIVTFNGVARNVAIKSGTDQDLITTQLQRTVIRRLKDNEFIVRAIAKKLMLHKVLRGKQLAPFLKQIKIEPLDDISEL